MTIEYLRCIIEWGWDAHCFVSGNGDRCVTATRPGRVEGPIFGQGATLTAALREAYTQVSARVQEERNAPGGRASIKKGLAE